TPTEDVVSILALKPGDEYSPHAVTEGVRRLEKRGLFADVSVYAAEEAGGIHLVVQVADKRAVKGVTVEGAKEGKKSDLQEVLTIGAGSLWDEAAAHEDQHALLAKLTEKGYHRGSVTAVIDTLPDNALFVHWKVDEGEKTRVKAVEFAGNAHVRAD